MVSWTVGIDTRRAGIELLVEGIHASSGESASQVLRARRMLIRQPAPRTAAPLRGDLDGGLRRSLGCGEKVRGLGTPA